MERSKPVRGVPAKLVLGGLIVIVVGLFAVGLVSGTPVRHIVQVLPVVLVGVAVWRRSAWAPMAALSIFLFWLLIMVVIWLFLLGIANITSGKFTLAEVMLTAFIGVGCVVGAVGGVAYKPRLHLLPAGVILVSAAILQVIAMWLSLQAPIALRRNRFETGYGVPA